MDMKTSATTATASVRQTAKASQQKSLNSATEQKDSLECSSDKPAKEASLKDLLKTGAKQKVAPPATLPEKFRISTEDMKDLEADGSVTKVKMDISNGLVLGDVNGETADKLHKKLSAKGRELMVEVCTGFDFYPWFTSTYHNAKEGAAIVSEYGMRRNLGDPGWRHRDSIHFYSVDAAAVKVRVAS